MKNEINIKLVEQPNTYTCVPAVASMLTGKPIDDFIDFINPLNDRTQGKNKGFTYSELNRYLAENGLQMGTHFDREAKQKNEISIYIGSKNDNGELVLPAPVLNMLAILTVPSTDILHCVLYANQKIYDPLKSKIAELSEYIVIDWYPVSVWGDEVGFRLKEQSPLYEHVKEIP